MDDRKLQQLYEALRREMVQVIKQRREAIKGESYKDVAYYDGLLEGLTRAAQEMFGPYQAWELRNFAREAADA